jgi:valyl-tRNA synthetase
MPFITEEVWQRVAPRAGRAGESIMRQPFPATDAAQTDAGAEEATRRVMEFVLGVRRIRGEFDIAPSVALTVFLENASATDRSQLEAGAAAIRRLAGVEQVRHLAPREAAPQSATALVGSMTIHVPMAGLIDVDAELARLDRRRNKVGQDLARAEAKLANPSFVQNAPHEVVAQEQSRVLEFKRELAQLAEQYERVASLR